MMTKRAAFAAAAMTLALTACRQTLDRERAKEMIRTSRSFSTPEPAPRVLMSVTGIVVSGDGKSATADFDWYFAGGPVGVAGVTAHSTARFRLYDDGWRIDEAALAEAVFLTGPSVAK